MVEKEEGGKTSHDDFDEWSNVKFKFDSILLYKYNCQPCHSASSESIGIGLKTCIFTSIFPIVRRFPPEFVSTNAPWKEY